MKSKEKRERDAIAQLIRDLRSDPAECAQAIIELMCPSGSKGQLTKHDEQMIERAERQGAQ